MEDGQIWATLKNSQKVKHRFWLCWCKEWEGLANVPYDDIPVWKILWHMVDDCTEGSHLWNGKARSRTWSKHLQRPPHSPRVECVVVLLHPFSIYGCLPRVCPLPLFGWSEPQFSWMVCLGFCLNIFWSLKDFLCPHLSGCVVSEGYLNWNKKRCIISTCYEFQMRRLFESFTCIFSYVLL